MKLKSAALTASLVVLCAMTVPQVATATVSAAGGASAICKAASGPGASVFYFDTGIGGALNTSGVTQYLSCAIPDVDKANGEPLTALFVHYANNTAGAVQFTCVVQYVHSGTSATNAVYTENVAANTPHYFNNYTTSSVPALPARTSDGVYIMSCAIPAGAALGSIRASYAGTIAP